MPLKHTPRDNLSDRARQRTTQLIGQRLRSMRDAHNAKKKMNSKDYISQEKLAQKVGIAYRVINGIENGHTSPQIDSLELIAAFWGMSLAEMLKGLELPTLSELLEGNDE